MLVTKAGGKYGQYDVKELLPGKSLLLQMSLASLQLVYMYCVLASSPR